MNKEELLQLLESVLLLSDGTSQFELLSKKGMTPQVVIFAKKMLDKLENEELS